MVVWMPSRGIVHYILPEAGWSDDRHWPCIDHSVAKGP